MAVRPSALGVLVVTVLKILTNTRKRVTRRALAVRKCKKKEEKIMLGELCQIR